MSKTKVPFPVLLNYVNGNKIHVKTQRKKDRLTKFLPYSVSTSEIVKDNHIIQLQICSNKSNSSYCKVFKV